MVERGISEKEVTETLNMGSKRRQNGKVVASHRQIEVVAKKIRDEWYVITVMQRW